MLNCLQDFGYNSVILMDTKFVITAKTARVPCATVVLKQKQPVTFFLRCQFFANERQKLGDDVYWIDASIKNLNESLLKESLKNVVLYGSDRFNDSKNKQILLHTIGYIQAIKRFERPLIGQC